METKCLAVISLCADSNYEKNLAQAKSLVVQAAEAGADWVLLPEVWTFMGPSSEVLSHADLPKGDLFKSLSDLARSLKICLFAGSYAEKHSGEKVVNVSYVFDRQGECVARYEKIHLFELKDADGNAVYCESNTYASGNQLVRFELESWKVGLSICYDLRFSALYQALSHQQGEEALDIISVPAAFTLETGKDHWELLLRARAVELQAFVMAANQFGENQPGKRTYGHSMIVDPWGDKIADTGEFGSIALATISKSRIQQVRSRLPAIFNRRRELY